MHWKGIFYILLLFGSVGYSQQKWTLEHCILYAIENNLQVKIQELQSEANKNNYLKSKMSLLPSINANANQGYTFGRTIDPLTNEFAESNVLSNNFSISGNWTLFAGFQNINTIRQQYYLLQSSLMDYYKAKNDIVLNVASFFLQIMLSKEMVQQAQNQYNMSKMQLERTQKLYQSGAVPFSNVLDIESQLASDELQLVNAQNSYNLSKLNLLQILEFNINDSIELEFPTIPEPDSIFPYISPMQIHELAKSQLPNLRSYEYKMLAAEKQLSVARSYRSPRITLSGSYATGYSSQRKSLSSITLDNPVISGFAVDASGNQLPVYSYAFKYNYTTTDFNQQLKDNISKSLMITLSIPIFNNWQANNAINSAKVQWLNAKYQYELADKQLIKEIQQTFNDAISAQKKYFAAKKAANAFLEAFKYTEERFNVGLANYYDYYLAKTNLQRTELELIKAKYEYIFKLKIVEFYSANRLNYSL